MLLAAFLPLCSSEEKTPLPVMQHGRDRSRKRWLFCRPPRGWAGAPEERRLSGRREGRSGFTGGNPGRAARRGEGIQGWSRSQPPVLRGKMPRRKQRHPQPVKGQRRVAGLTLGTLLHLRPPRLCLGGGGFSCSSLSLPEAPACWCSGRLTLDPWSNLTAVLGKGRSPTSFDPSSFDGLALARIRAINSPPLRKNGRATPAVSAEH